MKPLCLLFFISFISISTNSQSNWIDLPLEEGIWSTYSYAIGDGAESLPEITRHYSTNGDTSIDLSHFKNGVYILKITDGVDCLSQRIIKLE